MNIINKYINKLFFEFKEQKGHEKFYTISLYFVYLLYVLSYFSAYKYSKYINFIRMYLKYYVIIFLIIKFNTKKYSY